MLDETCQRPRFMTGRGPAGHPRRGLRVALCCAFIMALGMMPSAALATPVQTWRQESEKDFQSGKLDRVVVSSDGRVSLSRRLRPLVDVPADYLWSAVAAKDSVIVATGAPGLIGRVNADGKLTVLHRDERHHFFAVLVAPDGTIFAAASPGGAIWRIPPEGRAEEYVATGQTYVWNLGFDASGSLYAVTGSPGRLLRITPDRKMKTIFEAREPHLLSLAIAGTDVFYVGTSKNGLIYRFEGGKPFVVYDAPQSDIHVLLFADGVLYAGTGSPARPSLGSSTSRPSTDSHPSIEFRGSGGGPSLPNERSGKDKSSAATGGGTNYTVSSGGTTTTSTSGPPAPSAGENSVYRVRASGSVDEIFRDNVLVLSLAMSRGQLLVGCGKDGRLFQVDPQSQVKGEIARVERAPLTALATRADGKIVIGAAGSAKTFLLEDRLADAGTFESSVLDAKLPARWGTAEAKTTVPASTTLALEYRTGNLADPDATWSGWSPDPARLPVGRFLQYRARFTSPDGRESPSLAEFALYYATLNQSPKIEKIEVPSLQKNPVTSPDKKLTIRWQASDANGDSLQYRVEAKKDGWGDYITIAKELTKAEFEWDPAAMPGGEYRVRITADDKLTNTAREALEAQKSSDPFILDREAPAVQIDRHQVTGRRLEIHAAAKDQRSRLVSAAYSLDGKTWNSVFAEDGIFDSPSEGVSFTIPDLDPGKHVVLVRFVDAAGWTGVADLVVSVPGG